MSSRIKYFITILLFVAGSFLLFASFYPAPFLQISSPDHVRKNKTFSTPQPFVDSRDLVRTLNLSQLEMDDVRFVALLLAPTVACLGFKNEVAEYALLLHQALPQADADLRVLPILLPIGSTRGDAERFGSILNLPVVISPLSFQDNGHLLDELAGGQYLQKIVFVDLERSAILARLSVSTSRTSLVRKKEHLNHVATRIARLNAEERRHSDVETTR